MTYEIDSDVPLPPTRADYVRMAALKCIADNAVTYRDAGRSISQQVWHLTQTSRFDSTSAQAETLAKNLADEIAEEARR